MSPRKYWAIYAECRNYPRVCFYWQVNIRRERGRERDGFVYETDPLHCCHYHATGGRSIVLCLSVSEKLIVLKLPEHRCAVDFDVLTTAIYILYLVQYYNVT